MLSRTPSPFDSFSHLGGSGQGCLLLRASNEHILIVGVLRAKRAPGRSLLLLHDPAPASGSNGLDSLPQNLDYASEFRNRRAKRWHKDHHVADGA